VRIDRAAAFLLNTRLLRTTTFRLALGYLTLFAGSVILIFGFIYWTTVGYMGAQLDDAIDSEILGLSEQYRERGLEGLAASIRQRIARDPGGSEVYLLAEREFRPLIGNLDRWPSATESADGWLEFELRDRATPRGDVYVARARHFRLTGGFHLIVGRDSRVIHEAQRLILRALGWGLAITLALGIGGGLVLSRGTLRRLEAINRTSREIMAGDLSRRIPPRGTDDDFDQLAQNLNAMLDRIEALMAEIRHVTDGIAHDLRSPLTRLRNRLDMIRQRTGDADDVRRLAAECTAEADQLLATFNALLRIAEAESGRGRSGFTAVDLAAVVQDTIELYEPVAQEKRQTLVTNLLPNATVNGDRHLLAQALANLLDNAIKYGPEGARIEVTLRVRNEALELIVADNGPGVPEEARDKLTGRFYRLDISRSTPGSGLGLALVAAVAHLHDAQLAVDHNHPGLRITLTFPVSARP
jgi:signal transduction histidine kinase